MRYRPKRSACLEQILLLVIGNENREYLDIHKQGRNADGSPRNLKYDGLILNAQSILKRGGLIFQRNHSQYGIIVNCTLPIASCRLNCIIRRN